MNGKQLQNLTSELLDGRDIGPSKYVTLLKARKRLREALRPWMVLRTVDTSKTYTGADNFETLKDLPVDFVVPYNAFKPPGLHGPDRTPLVLVSGETQIYTFPTILGSHILNKDRNHMHYFDYAQQKYGITGKAQLSYTVHLHYIKTTTDPKDDGSDLDAWTWDLDPSGQFSPLLAYDIAIQQKGGIDYDEINARMVQYHGIDVREMSRSMIFWDDTLQRSALGK